MDKKTASPDNTKCFKTSYRRAKHDSMARYIHKYYLPQEVRQRIFLADIYAIMHEHDDWDVWDENLPESPPCCVVHYEDLCLEKTIAGHDVGLVLQAIAAYWHDLNGNLSDDERRAAINLNAWLMDWEKNLLTECVRTTEEMELRLRGGDPFLMDCEIGLELQFFLRDDDPFSEENNPEASDDDLDMDAALLCATTRLGGKITAAETADPSYTGLGDNRYHNDPLSDVELSSVRHCAIFHELYDHLHIPLKHMGRIGKVWADIRVWHQHAVTLDLSGHGEVVKKLSPAGCLTRSS